jgi:hypothetical protein
MNLIEIESAPVNREHYFNFPTAVLYEDQIDLWLKSSLQRGALNLHLPECPWKTVERNYESAVQSGYKIFVKRLPQKTDTAEFFFQRYGI